MQNSHKFDMFLMHIGWKLFREEYYADFRFTIIVHYGPK